MRMKMVSFLRKAIAEQSGQTMVMVVLAMSSLCAMAGLTLDVGHAYVVRTELQTAVNAGGLAAAEYIYANQSLDPSIVQSTAQNLVNENPIPGLTPTITASLTCLKSLLVSPATCTTVGNNAVVVTGSVNVPTYFMRIFGYTQMTINAKAKASWGVPKPFNIAIIVDATGSMFSTDPNCPVPGSTAEECAMTGVQSLLTTMGLACVDGQTTQCLTTSKAAVYRVALFTFPNISMTDVVKDWCGASGSSVQYQLYTFPIPQGEGSTAGYGPNGYITYTTASTGSGKNKVPGVATEITYLVTQHTADTTHIDTYGFSSDYYAGTNTLNASSILVKAVGNGSAKTCLKEPTGNPGDPTYYGSNCCYGITYQAAAIYAAQAELDAEQVQTTALGINATNAIIFVSDGQANAPSNQFVATNDTVTGNGYVTQTGTGKYPDSTQDCQQTIMAAEYAIAQGTRVYGVAYGTEANGCATDTKVVASGTLNVPVPNPDTPCVTMEDLSSNTPGNAGNLSDAYFYAEGGSGKAGCSSTSSSSTNVLDIFPAIALTMSQPRLVANNAT